MKTGGRSMGTPNKATSGLRELVEASTGHPLPFLLVKMGMEAYDRGDHHLAILAIAKACSYVYPRPTPTPDREPLPRIVIIDDIEPDPPARNEDGSLNVVIRLPTDHEANKEQHKRPLLKDGQRPVDIGEVRHT